MNINQIRSDLELEVRLLEEYKTEHDDLINMYDNIIKSWEFEGLDDVVNLFKQDRENK